MTALSNQVGGLDTEINACRTEMVATLEAWKKHMEPLSQLCSHWPQFSAQIKKLHEHVQSLQGQVSQICTRLKSLEECQAAADSATQPQVHVLLAFQMS